MRIFLWEVTYVGKSLKVKVTDLIKDYKYLAAVKLYQESKECTIKESLAYCRPIRDALTLKALKTRP